jgi:CRP-like cAMP-binding protein
MDSDPTSEYDGGNAVLDRLAAAERALLFPHLEVVHQDESALVQAREARIDAIWFPIDCICSVVAELTSGAYEVDVIGREGAVGAEIVLGAQFAPRGVICQAAGRAVRISTGDVARALTVSETFLAAMRESLRRQWFVRQQSVACNIAHSVEQRAARWILMSQDAIGRDDVPLRAEFFSMMLGIPAALLRDPLRAWEQTLAISYDGERAVIHSRSGLLEHVCECYRLQQMSPFIVPPLPRIA